MMLPLLLLPLVGYMQNLVPNPSFEQYANCPISRNDGRMPNLWTQPTDGTSDYYNSCCPNPGTGPCVPSNFVGTQSARTGVAYTGMYVNLDTRPQYNNYREYMQIQLSTTLTAGKTYRFEMYVSLADESQFACNKLGAYLSANAITANNSGPLNVTPQFLTTNYITDKNGWTLVSATYVATGGERYLTIGCFTASNTGNLQGVNGGSGGGWNRMSYYYIDDVSLIPDCTSIDTLSNVNISRCLGTGSTFTLTPSIKNADTYAWSTGSIANSIQINQSGTYWAVMSINGCLLHDTFNVKFHPIPQPGLDPVIAKCDNDTSYTLLKDQSSGIKTRLWSTGDTSAEIRVRLPGKYTVEVTTTYCTNKDSTIISEIPAPVLDLGTDTLLCFGAQLTLSPGQNGAMYTWSTGNTNAAEIVTRSGWYWLDLTRGQCTTRDSILVSFKPNPGLNLGPDTAVCENASFQLRAQASNADNYLWSTGKTDPNVNLKNTGTYWVRIQKSGCLYYDTINVIPKPLPTVNLGKDMQVCRGQNVNLSATTTDAISYTWSTGIDVPQISVTAPGNFSVTVVGSNGCINADTITIDTFTNPIVNLGKDSTFCEGNVVMLKTDKPFNEYLWQDGSVNSAFSATQPGDYTVTVKDANGCSTADTITLTMLNAPTFWLAPLIKVCRKDTLLTPLGNVVSYVWQDGSTNSTFMATTPGIYTVTVTDVNGCTSTKKSEVVSKCPASIFVPNVFSPNNDGSNETFFAVTQDVVQYHLFIYDRWGTLVFETTDTNASWNGKFESKDAPSDAYVYLINYTGANDISGTLRGNVTLIR